MGGPRNRFGSGWYSKIPHIGAVHEFSNNEDVKNYLLNEWPRSSDYKSCFTPAFWLGFPGDWKNPWGYVHFTVITSSCIAQYMLYRGSDSFSGTTPNMQLIEELWAERERLDRIEEHLKQREQADIEREKEIARRDRAVVKVYKGLQEVATASKKSFLWVCGNRG